MKHVHRFEEKEGMTEMLDELMFRAPLGILGRVAEMLFLTRYMRAFLMERNLILKELAESDRWKEFLGEEG